MSKFNQKSLLKAVEEYQDIYGVKNPHHTVDPVLNHEHGQAFSLSNEMELYSLVCTMGLSDKYYESAGSQEERLISLINKVDHTFLAKLAVYAREKMYLRSVPVMIVSHLARIHNGDDLVSRVISRIVQRPDDITEILAYYQNINPRQDDTKKLSCLSNQIKKGVRKVFESGRFDEYQYSKYNRNTEIKLRDALFLTHPKPIDDGMKLLFDKIINNTLEVPYTWETKLSEAGKTGSSKREVWEDMIDSDRLGYMAVLRNIRNFIKEGVSFDHIVKVCDIISDKQRVLKSKQLPFRFLSAYYSVVRSGIDSPFTGMIIDALDNAIDHSVLNIPTFNDECVLVSADVSGSMLYSLNNNSVIRMIDIGILMCAMAHKSYSVASIFGNDFKTINFGKKSVFAFIEEMFKRSNEVGYATNGWKVIKYAIEQERSFDRIMIFTDCQLYSEYNDGSKIDEYWNLYKSDHPQSKLYLFDLAGYGQSPIGILNNDVYLISGWSDKIFDIVHRIEKGQGAIDEINSISI